MVFYFSFFLSLTLIIKKVSFVFLYSAAVRNFLSWKVFLQISTDEHTSPSLLPPASTQLAGTTLLRLITTHTLPHINPTLGFHIFSIHEDLGVPLFADHTTDLTESFDSKLADAGNRLVRQLTDIYADRGLTPSPDVKAKRGRRQQAIRGHRPRWTSRLNESRSELFSRASFGYPD